MDFHLVPVPETALEDVYRVISVRMEEQRLQSDDAIEVPNNGKWAPEDMVALSRMVRHKAAIAAITRIATNSALGRQTSYDELRSVGSEATDEDFSYDNLRAQLSWVAKFCKRLKGSNVWPIEYQDRGKDLERGERHQYRLAEPLARAWLEAVGAEIPQVPASS